LESRSIAWKYIKKSKKSKRSYQKNMSFMMGEFKMLKMERTTSRRENFDGKSFKRRYYRIVE